MRAITPSIQRWRMGPGVRRLCHAGFCLVLGGLLSACGDEPKPAARHTDVASLMPADAVLAQTYDTSCKRCHASPASGAPLTGDIQGWAPRVAQGMDTLLDHSINGYNGMPPMGMCMQCSEEEFLALISFMSGQKIQ